MLAVNRLLLLTPILSALAQAVPPPSLRGDFQQAYAAYQAGQLVDAALRLEELARRSPGDFDVHELLGLTYAAESENGEAVEQLRTAVRLTPESVSARDNLATSLMHLKEPVAAEKEKPAALATEPRGFVANRNLARVYAQEGRLEAALPLLEAARQTQP